MLEPIDWTVLYTGLQNAHLEGSEDERLERARQLVERCYDQDLHVERLAKVACLSRSQFIRAFAKAYGQTPRQYLIDRRVRAARDLLDYTPMPVTEVCLEVGFSSLGSFSTLFRKHLGQSPHHYRRPMIVLPETLIGPRADPVVIKSMIPNCFLLRHGPGL